MFQMMILVFCALPVTKNDKAGDLLISALAGLLAQSDRQILVISLLLFMSFTIQLVFLINC